jgi:prepilin-type N-terminal cleavage/methylation domain-containing protein
MRKTLAQGFTLVELLIVIALLGVIATIVISAINPIEQANRASDAGKKSDASQVVSAIQRYYVAHQDYPWTTVDVGSYSTADAPFPYTSASKAVVGICGVTPGTLTTDCTIQGVLITSNEIMDTYLTKTFISSTAVDSMLYVGHPGSATSSVYVCWVPKSLSARQTLIKNGKVVDVAAGFTNGLPTYLTGISGCTAGPSDTAWTPATDSTLPSCAECVPE